MFIIKENFATLDNTKTNTENVRGLNWVVVKCTPIQYTLLLLQQKLSKLMHNLLYKAKPDRRYVIHITS
jgi:hypothetical protein